MQAEETKMILRYFGGIEAQLDDVNIELAELRDRYNPIKGIANVAVLGLGSFHCGVGLFLGQSVERGACAVGKTGNQTPRCKKFDFVRKNAPFLQIRCWN